MSLTNLFDCSVC